jgi:hypothetical protein
MKNKKINPKNIFKIKGNWNIRLKIHKINFSNLLEQENKNKMNKY